MHYLVWRDSYSAILSDTDLRQFRFIALADSVYPGIWYARAGPYWLPNLTVKRSA